jgi:hypothetical protein
MTEVRQLLAGAASLNENVAVNTDGGADGRDRFAGRP